MSKPIKLCVIVFFFFISAGCEKETCQEPGSTVQYLKAGVSKKQFKMSAKAWYRLSSCTTAAVPGMPGQILFANVPGAGSGTATNMGNVGMWFNQRAFSPDGQNPQAGTIPAPLAEAYTYSVPTNGAPLPALQPNDLRSLATLNSWLQIPATVSGKVVWFVVYNQAGDAVFLSRNTPSLSVVESATRTSFTADGSFVGGSGKFENASGIYHLTGFYNPEDANDGGISITGEVNY